MRKNGRTMHAILHRPNDDQRADDVAGDVSQSGNQSIKPSSPIETGPICIDESMSHARYSDSGSSKAFSRYIFAWISSFDYSVPDVARSMNAHGSQKQDRAPS
jgi:hypothetical protein